MARPPLAKLSPPHLPGVLRRPRLFRLLDQRRPLTWVWGPPGAGKTALVSSYLEARGGRRIWYRCDAGDTDASSFLGYLARAVGGRTAPARAPARERLRTLFARLPRPFIVVLDDYHGIPENSPVHSLVVEAVTQLPMGGRMIVASRAQPPAAFAGLRADRAVGEVGWEDLRLTAAETRALVRRLAPRFPPRLLPALHARTAGWAAGLVLLLQERRGLAEERRWAPDGVVEYFAGEILADADAETEHVLLETALLPQITGAMAEALTGRADAGRVLARLCRQNCFTMRHDEPNAVYEYHPLFRAFLRRRAHIVLPPARRTELRRRAAALLERDGQLDAAVTLLREAHDWEALASLVEARAGALIAKGRGDVLDEWLATAPHDVMRQRPWLLYWRAVRRHAAEPAASRADAEAALTLFRATGEGTGSFLAWALAVETFPWEQATFAPLDDWIACFEGLVREFPKFPSAEVETRVTAAALLALLCRQPHHREIKVWARRAVELAETTADVPLKLRTTFCALTYELWLGDFDSAGVLAGDLRMLLREQQVPVLGRVAAGLILARFEWLSGDFAGARGSVDAALAAGRAAGISVFRHTLMAEAAMIALSTGDRAVARQWLDDLRRDLPHLNPFARGHYHFLLGFDALLADNLSTALKEHEELLATTRRCGMPLLECLAHLFAAEALGVAGAAGAALHLSQATDLADQFDSALLRFMALLAEAGLAHRRGDEGRAVQTLTRALPIGREHGFVNTWLWQPRRMAELAVLALDADIEVEYVRRLVRERGLVPSEAPVEVETWPWPVKVFTLGRFEVLTGERPVRFSGKAQKKPLALLQALVAMGGQRVREDRLTEALWPDADGDAAHQALATTLHRLRRLLGQERAILRQDGAISLVREQCWIDLWAVERMLTRAEAAIARSPVRDHEWAASVRWSDRAVALYRGPFLAGDPALSWAAGVGERLRERLLRQLRKLGHLWESIGDWEEAAQCYERAVAIDEYAEEFYRRLMRAYERLARRADAIQIYQRCRQALAAVAAIPTSETEAIAKSLQVGIN